VPRTLAPILALFDGVRSLVDVQAEIMRQCGELVLRSQLESMVEILDQHLFLEGPRADAERARQRAAFLDAPTRLPFHAGRAYDDEPGALAAALDDYGLVAPHIDFHRGGPAYAWAYRALAEAPAADCFVLLGTAHAGLDGHAFAATAKAFETPFGPLEIDREVLDAVARRAPPELFAAELAHRSEHSIEFPAVWLQYLHRRRGGGAPRIVPLLASFAHECLVRRKSPALEREVEAVLDAVRDAMAAVPRRYCIVASADLAHVGPRFGDERPIGQAEAARVQADDHALLEPVVLNDAEAFFAEATRQQDRNRICGLSPVYALLRLLPPGPGRLLSYGQWPDPEGMVTFASVSFAAEAPGA
jgi:AmmeMemoRadiSam system protein B